MSDSLRTLAAQTVARADFVRRPYFVALREGRFEREDFVATQARFYHAVTGFARPLLALASRMDSVEVRAMLVANASDEHGGGDRSRSHDATFRALLTRLGHAPLPTPSHRCCAEVRAFNATLMGTCAFDHPVVGLATLGIIEDLFGSISGELGRGIVANGWVAAVDLVHYPVHEQLDVDHAEGFYRVLEPVMGEAGGVERISAGFDLGVVCFMRLYDDLFATRAWRSVVVC